ncbi:MAG: HDIG domain-containing protein [Blastocatellia bacterium]|nr:HDIG domain-containing protein [Blastocatellia bacterium]
MKDLNPPNFVTSGLPPQARELCEKLEAPFRLQAHLLLVHDVAVQLVKQMESAFPGLEFDTESVLFGAATHDLGKALYPAELRASGHQHELEGPQILEKLGVPPERARFAYTHAAWKLDPLPTLTLEDLLVSLADQSWKGKRPETLENQVVEKIRAAVGGEPWEHYEKLDAILTRLTQNADARLAWMGQF